MADSSSASTRAALIAWYDAHGRDLPWRRTRDPYAVWVSEVMLQQTRVDTVVPYFERFLGRFPDASSLATASEDEVLASWSGLGYYRRARMLHAGVREVVERYGGEVPPGAAERRSLPGVGRYTAGALGSICFDSEEPAVDGNVARVLSRLYAIEHPLGSGASERALHVRAEELVRGERPGDLNQSLMELGARVCRPKRPLCASCPIALSCAAHAQGRADSLPAPKKRLSATRVELVAVAATRGDALALVRGEEGMFAGLYGPPMIEGRGRDRAKAALRASRVGGRLEREPAGTLEHVLSHRVLDVELWRASGARQVRGETPAARLVSFEELCKVGISALTRRLIELAGR